jgi:hypothetical protein
MSGHEQSAYTIISLYLSVMPKIFVSGSLEMLLENGEDVKLRRSRNLSLLRSVNL